MIQRFVAFTDTGTDIEDCLFVCVEELERCRKSGEGVVIKLSGLRQVAEVHQGTDSDHKGRWSPNCNDADDVMFNVPMDLTSDLLEGRYTILEVLEPNDWL